MQRLGFTNYSLHLYVIEMYINYLNLTAKSVYESAVIHHDLYDLKQIS